MSEIWQSHATNIVNMMNSHNETQAHLYLEQLMLFPVDIQDRIIEEVSHLPQCNSEAVAGIIGHYAMVEIK